MFMFKEVPAGGTVDKAIALVQGELQEPWFLWVHLFDAHADYQPPPPYDVMFHDQPYDGEIAYEDRELGRLMTALDDGGLRDHTVVSLLGDHGDSLGDHGEQTHGIFIYRSTTHVPWVLSSPGVAPQRIAGAVSQVDVAPTLAALVGLGPFGADGQSLAKTLVNGAALPARDGVYSESVNPRLQFGWHELRGVDDGDHKYIEAPTPEAYDLTTDPTEQTNVWSGSHPLVGTLATLTHGDAIAALVAAPADAQTAAMLEELGYAADLGTTDGDELPDPKDVAYRWVDLQMCQALVRAERNEEAAPCLRQVIERDPMNFTAQASLAGVLRGLSRNEEALTVLEGALSRDADNVNLLESLAATLQGLGRTDDAVIALTRASELAPSDPDPPTQLGDTLQEAGRAEDALSAYGDALRRDDKHVPAYLGAANTYHRSGRSDRALAYLEEAKTLDPARHATWYNLGVVQDAMGQATAAEASYRRATELDPSHAMTWNNLGSLLKGQERVSEAERAFRTALEADPDLMEAKYNLGTLLIEDRPEAAVPLLRQVTVQSPDLAPGHHNLAVALARTGLIDEALAEHAWIVAHTPQPAGALLAMARLEVGRENRGRARTFVREAITAGGDAAAQRVADDPVLRGL